MDDLLQHEWARLYYELSDDDLLIVRALALSLRRARPARERTWSVTAPLVIGDRRRVTEPVGVERRFYI